MRREAVGSFGDWILRAKSDLALAKAPPPEGALLEDLAFHAQQAVEKSIKAVLVQTGIPFPRTHDIDELLALLPADRRPHAGGEDAFGDLTVYAVMTRYPGPVEPVTSEELRTALELAERAVSWAERPPER